MNEYKVIVQWRDGERSAYFYNASDISTAINKFWLDFGIGNMHIEVVAVIKKEC